jgi:hypothetical protein
MNSAPEGKKMSRMAAVIPLMVGQRITIPIKLIATMNQALRFPVPEAVRMLNSKRIIGSRRIGFS